MIGVNEQLIQRATHRIRLGTSVQLSGARTPRRDQRARIQSNKPFANRLPHRRLAQRKRTQLPRTPPQQTGGNTSHSTRQQKRRQRPVPHRHAADDEHIVERPTRYPDHRSRHHADEKYGLGTTTRQGDGKNSVANRPPRISIHKPPPLR